MVIIQSGHNFAHATINELSRRNKQGAELIWRCHLTSIGYPIAVTRRSYDHNGISCTGKTASLYWIGPSSLTHWGRVTHKCVGKLTIIGSDNGLSPERRQAIIWTYAGILLIGPLETNFSETLIEIQTFSLKKLRLKMSSAKYCSFRLGLSVLTACRTGPCSLDTTYADPPRHPCGPSVSRAAN